MATTDIVCHQAMGAGAPVFAPVPRWSETLASDTTTTNAAQAGDYITVTAVAGAVRVSFATGKTYAISDGAEKTFGPCKDGDQVTTAAI